MSGSPQKDTPPCEKVDRILGIVKDLLPTKQKEITSVLTRGVSECSPETWTESSEAIKGLWIWREGEICLKLRIVHDSRLHLYEAALFPISREHVIVGMSDPKLSEVLTDWAARIPLSLRFFQNALIFLCAQKDYDK
eukprot:3910476-Amphidinium_carterae.1